MTDTSNAAVQQAIQWVRDTYGDGPLDCSEADVRLPKPLAVLIDKTRALAQERDAAYAVAESRLASLQRAEAERDAARAEVERLKEALQKIVAADWWDAGSQKGDEPDAIDGRCAEIARAALAAKEGGQ